VDEIRFIDLFSGIGGFRRGLELSGGLRCVWSNDNNKYANQVYTTRFGEANHYSGDIRGVDPATIPDFDLLCAGFPCQTFSVAGKRKGFQDTRGTLFFEILRVAEAKRPSLLLLENVKGLLNHDGGRTFTVIIQSLDELGYWIEWQVLNSKHFGVPQNRERVFIVGHLRGTGGREIFPITEASQHIVRTQEASRRDGSRIRDEHNSVSRSLRVGGSGIEENLVAHTISKRYHKDGSENLLAMRMVRSEKGKEARREYQKKGVDKTPFGFEYRTMEIFSENVTGAITGALNRDTLLGNEYKIRRLTPVECERLQGFPDGWAEGISDTQRYKCLGNAVTVNVIKFLGDRIKESINSKSKRIET